MASRMDRYYETKPTVRKRSERNQDLYRDMYETTDYSNIEGVATIDKGSEIDINKVKEMLKNRENYIKQHEKGIAIKPIETPKFEVEEEKNYDIREVLNTAKNNRNSIDEHKSMNNTSYDIFKDLRDKRRREMEKDTGDSLKELINTISSTSMLNSMTDKELSLDLLDDLKSTENTSVADKDSIKKLLAEVKRNDEVKNEKQELDKSFYTSSLGFKEEDFEELNDIKNNLKTNNILIKILLTILTISFLVGAVILIFNLLK